MTRFDAPEYVAAFLESGAFPRIHDAITAAVLAEVDPADGAVLDLGSSTGLLTRRLAGHGYRMAAAQEGGDALIRGAAADLYRGVPVFSERVTPASLSAFLEFVETCGVTTIVARRVFPELHDALGDSFALLPLGLKVAGVRTIVHEARAVSTRTRHPLGTPGLERAALEPTWALSAAYGPVGVLAPA